MWRYVSSVRVSAESQTCRSETVSEKSPSVKARLLMFIFLWRNWDP